MPSAFVWLINCSPFTPSKFTGPAEEPLEHVLAEDDETDRLPERAGAEEAGVQRLAPDDQRRGCAPGLAAY